MIDLHNHILPGLDDGPHTLEGSLALARAAVAAGVTTVVATPHIDHVHEVQPAAIPGAVLALTDALAAEGIELALEAGGEVALTRLDELDVDDRQAVQLGEGPFLLLESPYATTGLDFDSRVYQMRMQGQELLLAHPERSPLFQREPARLARLVDAGVLCSISAGSITGEFGRRVRTFALKLLRDGLVHNVSSDAHDDRRRPPDIHARLQGAERAAPGLAAQAEWLTERVPAAILAGAALPSRPPDAIRRRRGRLF
ncbi:MAG: phosphotransferase [Actinomycetota bacterium]|nr:phosphotransferase [Actinomycetota bacterium]